MNTENMAPVKELPFAFPDDQFQKVFDQAPDGMALSTPEGKILYANGAFCKIFVCSAGEIGDFKIQERTVPEDAGSVLEQIQKAVSGEKQNPPERRFLTKDKKIFWARLNVSLLKNHNNDHLLLMLEDVTEKKQAQEKLRKSEERLAEAQKLARIGSWEWEVNSNAVYWSDELYHIYGFQPQEFSLTYEKFLGQVHPDDLEFVKKEVENTLKFEKGFTHHHRIVLPDGSVRILLAHAHVVTSDSGQPVRMYGTCQDVTELRQAEAALKESENRRAEELARSNRDLEQFAFVASHDLQEPLRTVANFTDLLTDRYQDRLDERGKSYCIRIRESVERMRELIDDVLDFSRVGIQGKDLQPVDLNTVVQSAVRNLQLALESSSARLEFHGLPVVEGDLPLLVTLFQNLIANGLKFQPKGNPPQIKISSEFKSDKWQICVCDNGIGIAPEYQQKVFEIFQRLHSRQDYPGTGIGLAMCKKIVEKHGGRIWVQSEPGKGSSFYFTLLPAVLSHH